MTTKEWVWGLTFWVLIIGAFFWLMSLLEPTKEQLAQEEKEMLATMKRECEDMARTYHLHGNLNQCAKIRLKELEEED